MVKIKKPSSKPVYNQSGQLPSNPITRATPQERIDTVNSDNILSVKNPVQSDIPLIRRDPTSKITKGVSLPNGDNFDNISPEEVQKIVDNWNNENAAPANSMYEDLFIKQQEDKRIADAKAKTVEGAQAKLGEPIELPPEDLLKDKEREQTVLSNEQKRKDADKYNAGIQALTDQPVRSMGLNDISAPAIRLADKYSARFASSIISKLLDGTEFEGYLKDYSDSDMYDAIVVEANNAIEAAALNLALTSNPETAVLGKKLYNRDIARIRLADKQLKMLYDKDPTIDKKDINTERTKIANYLDTLEPSKVMAKTGMVR